MLETFVRVEREAGANPAALHRPGRHAQALLEQARDEVASLLHCDSREVVFCGSATEANNLGVLGAARAIARLEGRPPRLISSRAEHPAVLSPLRLLQQEGFPLRTLPLDRHARIEAEALAEALAEDEDPVLLALQWANNETGAIQPLPERVPGRVHFHCDAVQGIGKLPWDPRLATAAGLVLSGHKIGAPKGIAVLRLAEDRPFDPVIAGGGHQRGVRPGTEAPALAAAFAHALRLALAEQEAFAAETAAAAGALLEELRGFFGSDPSGFQENQPPLGQGLPNTLNLSFPGIDGRALLPACDAEGLAVASGSACSSGSSQPSPVLLASGMDANLARASLRISFGRPAGAAVGTEAGRRLVRVLARLYKSANR